MSALEPFGPATPPQKWLLIDGSSTFGGHQVMLERWIGELGAQGRVVPRLLARDGSMLRERQARYVAASSLPSDASIAGHFGWLQKALADARVVFSTIEAEQPELCVLVEGCLLSQPWLALLCKLSGRPFATYIPITDQTRALGFRSGPIRDFLTKILFGNLPDAWVTLTREQADAFASWARVRRDVFVLPNAVAPHIEDEGRRPRLEQAEPGSEQRVLVFGRLDSYQKGLDFLLAFVERQARELSGLKLRLVGDGPGRTDVLALLERAPGLASVLELAAFSAPVPAMRAHDVLLLPSRFEGVPLVMLEAMALGLPVVASDLPGTRAFIAPECLFAVGDLQRAFEIVRELRDPERRRAVVLRNRERFTTLASGAAFSGSVARLTDALVALAAKKHLGRVKTRGGALRATEQGVA